MERMRRAGKQNTARQKAGYFVAIVFSLVAAFLAAVIIHRARAHKHSDDAIRLLDAFRRGVASPIVWSGEGERDSGENVEEVEPFFVDIDGDSFQDRVSIVSNAEGGGVSVVFERYNGTLYTRIAEGGVSITARSASFSAMDMTGNHRMEVVCHGTTPSGDAAMVIFTYDVSDDNIGQGAIKKIGDFRAANVFADVVDRTEAYNQSQAAGEPFHVWTYTSEGENEMRTEWNYSTKEGKYIAIGQSRVKQSEAARASGRATDEFLNGLWVRTENTDGDRFIYFDRRAKEILYSYQDIEEMYLWTEGRPRGGGVIITSTNAAIRTMKRRSDITVINNDEIRVRVNDAVRIVPNDTSAWDGVYRRMKAGSRLPNEKENENDTATSATVP